MSLLDASGEMIGAYMDFLEELSKEVGRNLNYEFNEFVKKNYDFDKYKKLGAKK